MAAGELNEISEAIGALRQAAVSLGDNDRAIFAKLETISNKLTCLTALQADVAAMKPIVDDYTRMKQRGIGVLAVVGIAAGALGAAIKSLIAHWWPGAP